MCNTWYIDWLIDWCLTPTLAVFQQYCGEYMIYIMYISLLHIYIYRIFLNFQCVEDFLYQNKNHTFNWLNTLHMTFTIPRYRLECWYRPAQKPCIDWYYWSIHGYLFAYVLINYNVTYNLILFLIISWTPFKQLL